jgi:hypothetical protein
MNHIFSFAIVSFLMAGAASAATSTSRPDQDAATAAAGFIAQFYSVAPDKVDVVVNEINGDSAVVTTHAAGKGDCKLQMIQVPNTKGGADWLFGGDLSCGEATDAARSS